MENYNTDVMKFFTGNKITVKYKQYMYTSKQTSLTKK